MKHDASVAGGAGSEESEGGEVGKERLQDMMREICAWLELLSDKAESAGDHRACLFSTHDHAYDHLLTMIGRRWHAPAQCRR
jgi:hypothetical protein